VLGFSKEHDVCAIHDTPGIKLVCKNPHGSESTMISFVEAVNAGMAHGLGKTMA